jgi:hypothetical protein
MRSKHWYRARMLRSCTQKTTPFTPSASSHRSTTEEGYQGRSPWLVGSHRIDLIVVPQRGGSERVLLEMNLSGFPEIPPGPHLAWTPDSRWLICTTPGSPQWLLSLIAADSGDRRILTKPSGTGLGDTAPAISPDRRALVFSRFDREYALYSVRLSEEYEPQGQPVTPLSDDTLNASVVSNK